MAAENNEPTHDDGGMERWMAPPGWMDGSLYARPGTRNRPCTRRYKPVCAYAHGSRLCYEYTLQGLK
eukprot:368148-Lingulodinium_polyedra.AAC.1